MAPFKGVFLLSAALLTVGCSARAEPTRTADANKRLVKELHGRSAGEPVECIRNYNTTEMQVIDDWTILFHEGRTIYVQHPRGGCRGLANGSKRLILHSFGISRTCSGDLNRMASTQGGLAAGTCIFTPFVPYTKVKS